MHTEMERHAFYARALQAWHIVQERFPGGCEAMMVNYAICMGHVEGHHANISGIAAMTGFSRQKVDRLATVMQVCGWVSRYTDELGRTCFSVDANHESYMNHMQLVDEVIDLLSPPKPKRKVKPSEIQAA